MTKNTSLTIAARINRVELGINNTIADSEIQSRVAAYGYTPEKMNQGKVLYDQTLAAYNAQVAAHGSQKSAADDLEKAKKAARKSYQDLSQVARAGFASDPAKLDILGLTGSMPQNTAGLLARGHALFTNAALPQVAPVLATFGYTTAKLQSEYAFIAALDAANQAHTQAKGAAQMATRAKEAAFQAMETWMKQYMRVAKVALADKKDMLEKIGGHTPSFKSSAQRKSGGTVEPQPEQPV